MVVVGELQVNVQYGEQAKRLRLIVVAYTGSAEAYGKTECRLQIRPGKIYSLSSPPAWNSKNLAIISFFIIYHVLFIIFH